MLKKQWLSVSLLLILLLTLLSGCAETPEAVYNSGDIPAYSGSAYIELNNNVPEFDASDFTTTSFETYSSLDSLGRCQTAFACVGEDLMPTEDRGDISSIKPTGWVQKQYDNVEGKSLYNRSHLIAHQLTGEDDNEKNLITGTRYMNVNMIPFENMVADYIKETHQHVLYRVTPVFTGSNLLADGVVMEAESVEDQGAGIQFNVFVYNVQPGITLDYATGESQLDTSAAEDTQQPTQETGVIRGNSRSKVYHCPGQQAYDQMADSKNLVVFNTEEEAQAAGYRKAKH